MKLYSDNEWQLLEQFVGLATSDISDHIEVSNAVATLALSTVQSRLPQCGVFAGEGKLTLTRKPLPGWRRDMVLLPQYLFMINWADSAPGISWPETYYATYLPLIDRTIVTASLESTDMWGVTDLAIGSFAPERDMLTGSRDVISAWWRLQRDHDQDRFAYVWDEGRISCNEATRWADQVWCPYVEEEEEQ